MIETFRDKWLREFFEDDVAGKAIPAAIKNQLFRRLQMVDDATNDQDLRVPPSNHFEKLSGKLSAYHSVRVNKKWRLVFKWDGSKGKATNLYLGPHDYK